MGGGADEVRKPLMTRQSRPCRTPVLDRHDLASSIQVVACAALGRGADATAVLAITGIAPSSAGRGNLRNEPNVKMGRIWRLISLCRHVMPGGRASMRRLAMLRSLVRAEPSSRGAGNARTNPKMRKVCGLCGPPARSATMRIGDCKMAKRTQWQSGENNLVISKVAIALIAGIIGTVDRDEILPRQNGETNPMAIWRR
jgi:hypothetical protein